MNGTKKIADFLADVRIPFSAAPDPYKNPPACKLNLLELAKYAEAEGKDVSELSIEEIARFKV
ncbi:hypothetical protein [Fibrobacter sp.]|uniref:hypothetical protein n=1 Tax=Fibrobacter sp. TaxID=35828 RepID=UPI003863E950